MCLEVDAGWMEEHRDRTDDFPQVSVFCSACSIRLTYSYKKFSVATLFTHCLRTPENEFQEEVKILFSNLSVSARVFENRNEKQIYD